MDGKQIWAVPPPPPEHIRLLRGDSGGSWFRRLDPSGAQWARCHRGGEPWIFDGLGEHLFNWMELISDYPILIAVSGFHDLDSFWTFPRAPGSHILTVIAADGAEWGRQDPAGHNWVACDGRRVGWRHGWASLLLEHGPLTTGREEWNRFGQQHPSVVIARDLDGDLP